MVIPILADILNATEKEKVKRIILATYRVTKRFEYCSRLILELKLK